MISSWAVRKRSIVAAWASITSASSSSAAGSGTAVTCGGGAVRRRRLECRDGRLRIDDDRCRSGLRWTAPVCAGTDARILSTASPARRSIGHDIASDTSAPTRAGRIVRTRIRLEAPDAAVLVEVARVELDVVGGEHRHEMVQLRRARSPRKVGGHGAVRTPAEDVVDEAGHVPARTGLDEDAGAVVVERSRSCAGTRPGCVQCSTNSSRTASASAG